MVYVRPGAAFASSSRRRGELDARIKDIEMREAFIIDIGGPIAAPDD
jgi:hypothetical protein